MTMTKATQCVKCGKVFLTKYPTMKKYCSDRCCFKVYKEKKAAAKLVKQEGVQNDR